MGFLDRLRGTAKVGNAALAELQSELNQVRALRVPLYLNEHWIGQTFTQRRKYVTQTLASGGINVELSGGAPGIVSAKGAQSSTASETVEITPLMQALLLEETERKRGTLVELNSQAPKPGAVCLFVGPSHIFGPWEPVAARAGPPEITAETATKLQAYREQQEQKMRSTDHELPGTLVWHGIGVKPLASVGSARAIQGGALASYATFPPFGILAVLEGDSDGIAFLRSLVIWHDPAVQGE